MVSYIRAIRETFRDPVHTGQGGRPPRRPWRHVLIAQVVKRYERRRVVATDRRLVDGTPARVETLRRRLHAACEFVPYATDDPGHGGGDHRPLLDDAGTAVVSCAAAPLGTPEAARASFAGIATPDQALVFVTTVKCGATLP